MAFSLSRDASFPSNGARAEWVLGVANALQALVGGLCGVPSEGAADLLADVEEAATELERLIFRGFVADFLLNALHSRTAVTKDLTDSVKRAWPAVRQGMRPVAALRDALVRPNEPQRAVDLALAEHVRALLDDRFTEKLLAHSIASELHVSESRMSRCFYLAFGTTPRRYLSNLRARRGLQLVCEGMKIEAAALMVGFHSKKDFYRAARQLVGCTPAQFRSRAV